MKKILLFIAMMWTVTSYGQGGWVNPNPGAVGTRGQGLDASRFIGVPTLCGTPSAPAAKDSILKKAGVCFDSCGHKFYAYDPAAKTWTAASSVNTAVDTIYKNAAADSIIYQKNGHRYAVKDSIGASSFVRDTVGVKPRLTATTINAHRIDIDIDSTRDMVGHKAATQFFADSCARAHGGNPWNLSGNSGTTAGTNFIGTTDSMAFVAKTNSVESFRIGIANQYIGLGRYTAAFGTYNITIGDHAKEGTTSGDGNVTVGQNACSGSLGSYNTYVGQGSGNSSAGSYNSFVGATAGVSQYGKYVVGMGQNVLDFNSADSVTAIGSIAAYSNTGIRSTFLGMRAGGYANPYRDVIALGYLATPSADKQLVLSDSIVQLKSNMTGSHNNGYVLTTNGSGIATFQAGGGSPVNIYNTDGALTGDRVVTMAHTLDFLDGGGNKILYMAPGNIVQVFGGTQSTEIELGTSAITVDGTTNFTGGNVNYNSGDPYFDLNGSSRRFRMGDYTNDWYNTWVDVNDSVAVKQVVLHAAGGVIVPDGNVGIGTATPAVALDVNGSIESSMQLGAGNVSHTGSLVVDGTGGDSNSSINTTGAINLGDNTHNVRVIISGSSIDNKIYITSPTHGTDVTGNLNMTAGAISEQVINNAIDLSGGSFMATTGGVYTITTGDAINAFKLPDVATVAGQAFKIFLPIGTTASPINSTAGNINNSTGTAHVTTLTTGSHTFISDGVTYYEL